MALYTSITSSRAGASSCDKIQSCMISETPYTTSGPAGGSGAHEVSIIVSISSINHNRRLFVYWQRLRGSIRYGMVCVYLLHTVVYPKETIMQHNPTPGVCPLGREQGVRSHDHKLCIRPAKHHAEAGWCGEGCALRI